MKRHVMGLLCLAIGLGGCATYYQVKDVTSGRTYVTKKVHKKQGGAVQFNDDRTDDRVTLQSSEVRKIPKADYKRGLVAP